MVISGNRYLTKAEMKENAQYIMSYLTGRGWTKNAVAGMLGNMETESTINPGIWQGLHQGNMGGGFGLVQWTPANKYTDWATSKGFDYKSMDANLARIEYEVQANIQWMPTDAYPITFAQFKTSNETPEYLGQAFLKCYERPADGNQPERSTQARYWFDKLSGEGSTGGLQLAQFPMDMIHITQGENGSWSHMGILAIDFVGTHPKYPYYAPCDCECIRASNDLAVWKSDKEVMCADGQVRKIFWDVIHEVPLSHGVGTKLKKGELMGHTGVGGTATGDHLHLQVMNGWDYQGFGTSPQGASTLVGEELHIFDVFAVNGVNIVDGYGYPWKTSDYVDGSQGGNNPPSGEKKKNRYIELLLVDALNGWR